MSSSTPNQTGASVKTTRTLIPLELKWKNVQHLVARKRPTKTTNCPLCQRGEFMITLQCVYQREYHQNECKHRLESPTTKKSWQNSEHLDGKLQSLHQTKWIVSWKHQTSADQECGGAGEIWSIRYGQQSFHKLSTSERKGLFTSWKDEWNVRKDCWVWKSETYNKWPSDIKRPERRIWPGRLLLLYQNDRVLLLHWITVQQGHCDGWKTVNNSL